MMMNNKKPIVCCRHCIMFIPDADAGECSCELDYLGGAATEDECTFFQEYIAEFDV